MEINQTIDLYLEIIAVISGLAYIILLVRENIWCWLFAIISAIFSIYLFYRAQLYSEAILYFYYIFNGIYAWWIWSGKGALKSPALIRTWSLYRHGRVILLSLVMAFGLGYFFKNNSDAQRPYLDAGSTIFSFTASYLEAHKVLNGWVYWIVINLFSVFFYLDRNLNFYASLMGVYFVISIIGYISWQKKYRLENSIN